MKPDNCLYIKKCSRHTLSCAEDYPFCWRFKDYIEEDVKLRKQRADDNRQYELTDIGLIMRLNDRRMGE